MARKQRGCTANTSSDPGENANFPKSNQTRPKASKWLANSTV